MREDLREQVRRIVVRRHVADDDLARAAHLPHLEELAIDVARVLRGRESVAKVVGALVVRIDVDRPLLLVSDEEEELSDVDELDRAVGERDQLGLAGRHRDAVLATRSVRDDGAAEKNRAKPVVDRVVAQLLSAYALSSFAPSTYELKVVQRCLVRPR